MLNHSRPGEFLNEAKHSVQGSLDGLDGGRRTCDSGRGLRDHCQHWVGIGWSSRLWRRPQRGRAGGRSADEGRAWDSVERDAIVATRSGVVQICRLRACNRENRRALRSPGWDLRPWQQSASERTLAVAEK